ncbi:MAG TPA: DNA topoisomerase IB [Chthoniobacterales bacterium]|jgi:DNA topoisomerase-1|nr:DNA topoisomerase IB [Chthoniobacterales bacterium]
MPSKKLRAEKKKIDEIEIAPDPVEVAEEAGLRYVNDEQPGYTRKAKGDDFDYFDTEGKRIRDETRLLRIKRLAIPPAYKHVWICPSANGHIQATARDARGRKQYRYHERWRAVRDENKYDRMLVFGKALPKIRRRVNRDLRRRGLPREKVLATVVQLLERTFIRVGNEEYAKENKSFGLTTLRNRHVDVTATKLKFSFRGKSGKDHEVDVTDRRLAKIIRQLQDLPGQEVFQYLNENEERRKVTSEDVNEYLREITGEEFTAKDFRTWAGTVLAAMALNAQEAFENKSQAKKNVKDAISAVAKILGNTPAVCRKCYVHPAVLETYLDGAMIEGLKQKTEETLERKLGDLRSEEAAVMSFLQARLNKKA